MTTPREPSFSASKTKPSHHALSLGKQHTMLLQTNKEERSPLQAYPLQPQPEDQPSLLPPFTRSSTPPAGFGGQTLPTLSTCIFPRCALSTSCQTLPPQSRRTWLPREPCFPPLIQDLLRNMLEYYQGGVEMIRRDLLTGHWLPYLEPAISLKPCYEGGINGGELDLRPGLPTIEMNDDSSLMNSVCQIQ